jgi:hypothetical protein
VFNYEVLDIFNKEDIKLFNKIYDECTNERVKRLHNLFYVDYRNIPSDKAGVIKDKLGKRFKLSTDRNYFLNYTEGSFTRRHADVGQQSQCTVITLLEKSDDLIGGETIVYTKHYKKDNFEFDVNRYKRLDDKDDEQGADIVPHVVNLEVGQSVVYDVEMLHEVAEVLKGNRKVLVSWLK